VGFHGYGQNARAFLEVLRGIPGSERWLIASVQALHPFYHPRTNEVIASWMTREDREHAIADNVAYVDAVLDDLAGAYGAPRAIVFAGFSQGVAMAYRAAVLGARRGRAIFAAGGDLPPELAARTDLEWPAVVACTGTDDSWYTPALLERDLAVLRSRGAAARGVTFRGGHDWSADVSAAAAQLLAGIASAPGAS
jgi:predicted esterase